MWNAADAEGRDLTPAERSQMEELVAATKSQHSIEQQIRELEDGGAPRDPENLMSCCRSHHSVIHAQRRRGKVA